MIAAILIATTCLCGEAPERANDFFWENDRTGFRAYGPGDVHKWSGIDVFNKATTNNFVVHLLRGHGDYGNWHKNVKGLGMDDYAVGPGRGVGGVAFRKDGKWLSDYGNWVSYYDSSGSYDYYDYSEQSGYYDDYGNFISYY